MRRKLDAPLALNVPAGLLDDIDAAADREMCSRSALVRKAISEHLKRYQASPGFEGQAA